MSTTKPAGSIPRTTTEVPSDEKSGVCDVCYQRAAVGAMPDGRSVCRPCARREPVKNTVPERVDPREGDTVLFESQGIECCGRVLRRSGSSLTVEVSAPEEIVVEQVVEVVDGGDA